MKHNYLLCFTMDDLSVSGGATGTPESSVLQEASVHYNIPELQSPPSRLPPHPNTHSFVHPLTHTQPNGQHFSAAAHREASGTRDELSASEDSGEEDDDEEEEAALVPRWQGIESVLEAYQEYVEGRRLGEHTRRLKGFNQHHFKIR